MSRDAVPLANDAVAMADIVVAPLVVDNAIARHQIDSTLVHSTHMDIDRCRFHNEDFANIRMNR